jgi:hypothetical protein
MFFEKKDHILPANPEQVANLITAHPDYQAAIIFNEKYNTDGRVCQSQSLVKFVACDDVSDKLAIDT